MNEDGEGSREHERVLSAFRDRSLYATCNRVHQQLTL